METMIGRVTHYYPKVGVAAVVLDEHLEKGDQIHIHGPREDVYQTVQSMEIDHIPIDEADPGQDIGIKVVHRVHEGALVYRDA